MFSITRKSACHQVSPTRHFTKTAASSKIWISYPIQSNPHGISRWAYPQVWCCFYNFGSVVIIFNILHYLIFIFLHTAFLIYRHVNSKGTTLLILILRIISTPCNLWEKASCRGTKTRYLHITFKTSKRLEVLKVSLHFAWRHLYSDSV